MDIVLINIKYSCVGCFNHKNYCIQLWCHKLWWMEVIEEELVLPLHIGLITEFIAHGTAKVELWLLYFNNLTVVILFLQAKVISFMCQFSFTNKAILLYYDRILVN